MTSVAIGPTDQLDPRLLEHRRELTGYCYRMLGSSFDAEDAVQETMVRAWRGLADFEGRSALRSWLYRIATNVCLDQLSGRQRRALPMDLSGSTRGRRSSPPWPAAARGTAWVEPVLDRQVLPEDGDPAERAVARESIRLAFVAALQHLPPRQRAVLILREVLRWKADEVAAAARHHGGLGQQRAAAGPGDARRRRRRARTPRPLDADDRELLARYVDAFERYDIDAFVRLLHEDATQHMPPFEMWLRGPADIGTWMLGPGSGVPRARGLVPRRGQRVAGVRAVPAAARAVVASRGRCTCSRSRTAGSPTSPASSTSTAACSVKLGLPAAFD